MTSKVLYLVPCFLFACCVTVSAIGDHFEGEKMAIQTRSSAGFVGVTTSRATSGGRRKDRNTSGQRRNRFNDSYRDCYNGFTTLLFSATTTDMSLYELLKLFPR